MLYASQDIHAFLRVYYHHKSTDWITNQPCRLAASTATKLAKMSTCYIMDLDMAMAETVAQEMPTEAEIENQWLPNHELRVYSEEFDRTGFQGGLQ